MKSKHFIFTFVAALAVLAGCQQKPSAEESDPLVEIDQQELTFTQSASNQAVTFISTRAWAAKDLPDWVIVEPPKGPASLEKQTVTVSVLENTDKNRETKIMISGGIAKGYITVKQSGPGGEIVPGDGSKEHPFSATEARVEAAKLASGAESDKAYYVHGFVKNFASKHEDGVKNFGNALFYITDDNTLTGDDFYCYQVYYLGGKQFTSTDQIKIGDEVVVYGKITNYNGTYETVGKGAAFIYSLNGKTEGGDEPGPIEPITGTNLLSNGGFESWTGAKPDGWDFTNGNAELSNSSDAKEGSNSCEVKGDAASNKRLMSKQYTLKPGTYQIQAYFKGEGQYRVGYAKLTNGKIADSQNDYVYIDKGPVQASSTWEQHIVQFTLSAQTQISVNVMNNQKGDGKSFLIDDVRLVTNDGGVIEGGDTPATVVDATVAQVISEQRTDVIYRLSGTVSNFNSQYCSFDITDATGSIYVFSVISATKDEYKNKLKNGDNVTIEGEYQFYQQKSQHEIVNAKITAWTSGGGGGEDFPDPATLTQITCKEFNALPATDTGWYILEGEVMSITDNSKGVLYIKDASGEMAYIYEVLNASRESGKFPTLGIEPGDVLKVYGKHVLYNDVTVEMSPAVFMELTKGEHPEIPAVVTLTFPDDNNVNNHVGAYNKDWVAKSGAFTFTISCFNNNNWSGGWSYIRGGYSKSATKPYIVTADAIEKPVGSVIVTFDKMDKSIVNSAKLIVATDAAFSQNPQTVDIPMEIGSQTINVPTPGQNLYYKLDFDFKQATANGVIQISKIVFAEAQ